MIKRNKAARGYTIIEVMIVLGVTGAIFLIAVIFISGRTSRTQFTQAIQNVQSQIQQTINEVTNGFYPNNANFTCSGSAGNISIATGGNGQGTNQGCIFLGKVLQFGINNTSPQQFISYSVAALQLTTTGQEVQSYAVSKPLLLAPGNTTPGSGVPATLSGSSAQLNFGLTAINMYYCTTELGCTPSVNTGSIGSVAFLSSLANYNGGQIVSGSQHVNLIPIAGSALNAGSKAGVDSINTKLRATGTTSADAFATTPPSSVKICFKSGNTNQSGLISIGGGATGQLVVTLSIKNSTDCT